VDLLDNMAVTIDLKRQVALLGAVLTDPKAVYEKWSRAWATARTHSSRPRPKNLQPASTLRLFFYTPHEQFQGSDGLSHAALFKYAPKLHYTMDLQDVLLFGKALW
jgi:hypothetical protein